jgi:hypothetical protein
MRSHCRIFWILPICVFLFTESASAQPNTTADSIRLTAAIHSAARQYQDFLSVAAPLYSGPQYVEYYLQIQQGQPFFLNTEFLTGNILYDHILYENVSLKYDMVQSRIVLKNASGTFRISPSNDKIDSFSIQNHSFIKLEKNNTNPSVPKNGFYEVLYTDGRISLLKKETKQIQEDLKNWSSAAVRYILSSVDYYIKDGNTFTSVRKKKQILEYVKTRKIELRQFIRKKDLDFGNDTDNALVSVLTYYQSLTK